MKRRDACAWRRMRREFLLVMFTSRNKRRKKENAVKRENLINVAEGIGNGGGWRLVRNDGGGEGEGGRRRRRRRKRGGTGGRSLTICESTGAPRQRFWNRYVAPSAQEQQQTTKREERKERS